MREYRKAWEARNPKLAKEVKRRAWAKWAAKNKEKLNAACLARYYADHEGGKERARTYKRNNPAGNAARQRAYKAGVRQAAPAWLTAEHKAEILVYYTEANRLSELTGIQFQVDHIVPLKGATVRGLHVPWNLQVLPYYENISKSNTW